MSDNEQEAAADGGAAPAQPSINVHAQYIKDLSFEVPNAPAIFAEMQEAKSDININVDLAARPLQEPTDDKPGVYEVALDIRAECKAGDKTAFIMELAYAGVFEVGAPAEHLHPVLLIECPRLLFPFARNIIADATRDGGFPPLMMAPIDFVNMFQQRVAKEQAEAAEKN